VPMLTALSTPIRRERPATLSSGQRSISPSLRPPSPSAPAVKKYASRARTAAAHASGLAVYECPCISASDLEPPSNASNTLSLVSVTASGR
jgi:hypothetical protein